jgi:hypothetical protein
MQPIDSFEEFLRKRKEEEAKKPKVDWVARKAQWLKSVNDVYASIQTWLDPLKQQGLVDYRMGSAQLSEEFIGRYEASTLEVIIGRDKVSFTPRGTIIIGSYGRIDVSGPRGDLMLIEREWDSWEFARRTPKLETWDLDANSFNQAIQSLI